MGQKQLVIGMFGFGNVGRGLYDVLKTITSKEATIKRVCVRDLAKERGVEENFFTDNADDIFNDKDINLIVELIDDAEALRLSMLICRRVNTAVIWLSRPAMFSECTISVYSFFSIP